MPSPTVPKDKQIEAVERAANSLGIRFEMLPESYIFKYDPNRRALVGDPNRTVSAILGKAEQLGVSLSESKILKELEAFSYHESLHGFIWERLGPRRPARYIPEEHWIEYMTDRLYGEPEFEGYTFFNYADKKLKDWRRILELILEIKVIDCEVADTLGGVLYLRSKNELSTVDPHFGELKDVCLSVSSWADLPRAERETREVLRRFGIKVLEEVCT
ncbi:MAG: hypothetical protein JRD89_18870 [Deltaproteobacteria bacterium]|nr:hypothetical protein [Deltaproteobacteria bacterium]